MKFTGKVAIVTGGGRDIGRAISIKLAREGAKVAVNYCNNAEDAAETGRMIAEFGGEFLLVKADLTSIDGVNAVIQASRQQWGERVDILVNVAGGLVARKALAEMDDDFFSLVMRLNVTSTFLMTQAVAPLMPKGSAIVNIASQAGRDGGGPGAAAYATSKGAVMSFTRAMAKELGPRGIRVNALCPGMIATSFHDSFTKPEVRSNVAAATPLKREGGAEEIASAVSFLASDEASFVHGANIDINGGLLMS